MTTYFDDESLMNDDTVRLYIKKNGEEPDHKKYTIKVKAKSGQAFLDNWEYTFLEPSKKDLELLQPEVLKIREKREKERLEKHKKAEEETAAFIGSLRYETRLVAFIDILGWKAAIIRSIDDPELAKSMGVASRVLSSHVKSNKTQRSFWQDLSDEHGTNVANIMRDTQITHFSDSILISTKANQHAKWRLESTLSILCQQMAHHGFLLRGGVTVGSMIHKESSVAYGPALIEAYRLENEVANYPQIMLDENLTKAWGHGENISDKEGNLLGIHNKWRKSDNGFMFFDYLKPAHAMLKEHVTQKSLETHLQSYHTLIVENRGKHNDRINEKYEWLVNYFNQTLEENIATKFDKFD